MTEKENGLVVVPCTADASISTYTLFSLLLLSFKEYIANPPEPKGKTKWTKKKTKQDKEDKHIIVVINTQITKDKATKEVERHKNKGVEVADIM